MWICTYLYVTPAGSFLILRPGGGEEAIMGEIIRKHPPPVTLPYTRPAVSAYTRARGPAAKAFRGQPRGSQRVLKGEDQQEKVLSASGPR
jgi:hypothetical protein